MDVIYLGYSEEVKGMFIYQVWLLVFWVWGVA